jgi:restriction endonuclease S subunit
MIRKQLREVATIVAGTPARRRETAYRVEAFPLLTLKDVGRELAQRDKLSKVEGTRHDLSRYLVKAGDVIVTTRGNDVRAVVVQPTHTGVIAGANLAAIRPDKILAPALLAAFLCEPKTQARLLRETAGASTPGFTIKALGDLPISIPTLERQRTLVHFIQAAEAHREALTRSIECRQQACRELILDELLPQEASHG